MVNFSLEGKVALVTGASYGIGFALATAFAEAGAKIAFNDIRQELVDKGLASYKEKGIDAKGYVCDVTKEEQVQELVAKIEKDLGPVNILVNNAGVQFPQQRIQDISEEQLYTTFEVNVFSMFYFVKAVLDHGVGCESIINTASVTAYQGETDLLDYSATKGAIVSFTRALSQSLAEKNIRVNAVAPGPIWTPLIPASFSAEKVARFGQDVPMRRAGQPCELAPAYVYLASGDSSYVTGQVIHVNGGTITGS